MLNQADAIRRRSEEVKQKKREESKRKAEQAEQDKAEKEVMERVNRRGIDHNGATIDWDIVQI